MGRANSTVYTHCTKNKNPIKGRGEFQLGGADLYGRLRDFLKKYIKGLYKVRDVRNWPRKNASNFVCGLLGTATELILHPANKQCHFDLY